SPGVLRRVAPTAGRDAGGRRVGGVRRSRPAGFAATIEAAWLDRSVADSTGSAMVSGAVCVVWSALPWRTLEGLEFHAPGTCTARRDRGHQSRRLIPNVAHPGSLQPGFGAYLCSKTKTPATTARTANKSPL